MYITALIGDINLTTSDTSSRLFLRNTKISIVRLFCEETVEKLLKLHDVWSTFLIKVRDFI